MINITGTQQRVFILAARTPLIPDLERIDLCFLALYRKHLTAGKAGDTFV